MGEAVETGDEDDGEQRARLDEHGLPVGRALPEWTARNRPDGAPMRGRYATVRRLNPERDALELFNAFASPKAGGDWTYMSAGPFERFEDYRDFTRGIASTADPLHHTVVDARTGRAAGTVALMRTDKANGVTEIGWVSWSRSIQRTPVATEAIYLLLRRCFDEFGYRRVEWKCDSLNARSRRAAQRLGFEFEGVFRQAVVYKGRSRDTAWYSVIDRDWPRLRDAFEAWLDPVNFDANGRQRRGLEELRVELRGGPMNNGDLK